MGVRLRYDADLDALVPADSNFFEHNDKRADFPCPMVMGDIKPYQTIAGDVANDGNRANIGSRSEHRDFLRRNNYVEVGNDKGHEKPRKPKPLDRKARRDAIKRAVYVTRNPWARGDKDG